MAFEHNTPQVVASLKTLIDKRNRFMVLGVKKIVIDAHTDVIKRSPVDTGRFRASNFLVVGEGIEAKEASVGRLEGSKTELGSEAAVRLAEGASKISQALGSKIPEGHIIFQIINSLPYAQRLEEGWSQQAPQGMYRLALQQAQKNLARFRSGLDAIR